jgi:CDP-6-deoxy-D-xylo-4-hexulose-3-dehydrase
MAQQLYQDGSGYLPIRYSHMDTVSNFAVPVITKTQKQRFDLVKRCARVVEIRPIVGGNMTMQPFFTRRVHTKIAPCPNAEFIHLNGLYVGNNPEMTGREINSILSVFC